MTNCPYLGLFENPDSRFLYATSANYCHKVAPVAPVKPSYQESRCLSEVHHLCPVYQGQEEGSLPPEARGERSWKTKRRNYLWIGFVLVLAILVGWGMNTILKRSFVVSLTGDRGKVEQTLLTQTVKVAADDSPSGTKVFSTNTPSPSIFLENTVLPAQTNTIVETQPITLTSTNVFTTTPSLTASVTNIPTTHMTPTPEAQRAAPAPNFQTPFGPQNEYVIHAISEGENLPLLSRLYDTTPETIIALNTWVGELGLRPNRVIVIMPGRTDSSEVAPLSVDFTQEEITILEFAASKGVSIEDVRTLNVLRNVESISAGRWLIYPYMPETLTPTPTSAPTPDLSKALTAPFGPHNEYILHEVTPGESLNLLEKRYLTSTEVIQKLNVIFGSIQIGQILVIMPGETEMKDTTKFAVFYVESTISIEKLASNLGVLYADILYYNGLTQRDDIPAGRWVIYPYTE